MQAKRRRIIFVKLTVLACAALLAVFCFLSFSAKFERISASSSGPVASHTNAPNEGNCTACHTGSAANSGAGNISISGVPNSFVPNQQIPVTVTVNQSDAVIYGFQLTALDAQGRKIGTYTLPAQSPAQLQLMNGFVNGAQRQYVEHTVDGVIPTVFGTKSWTFMWNAPAQRIGSVSFYAAGNATNSDGSTAGDYIYTTAKTAFLRNNVSNFDVDGKSDVAVFRPSESAWFSYNSTNGAVQSTRFGSAGDKPVAGDFDGDGKSDIAVWRPSDGAWYVQQSTGGLVGVKFGTNGDAPTVGDYDGDGKTDLVVWRPSDGIWYILRSGDNGYYGFRFGQTGDKPVQGDYDGDGKTDAAVFRPAEGSWYLNRSRDGVLGVRWGAATDKPVQADYDGDGKTDIAVYRPAEGSWYILYSAGGYTSFGSFRFGASEDKPVPADYDGGGKTDIAVYRPSEGIWYILPSSTSGYYGVRFGNSTDIPLPASGFIAE